MVTPPWYDTPEETLAFNIYVSDLEERIREAVASNKMYVDLNGLSPADRDYVIRRIEEELSKK